MDIDQVALVQDTWKALKSYLQGLGKIFYHRLFELDPAVVILFLARFEMGNQGLLFMEMVDNAVENLGSPEAMVPTMLELGERHVS